MERCAHCGAATPPGQAWCGQCFAPSGAPVTAERSVMAPVSTAVQRPAPAVAALPPAVRRSRWRGSQTTFGPVGRVVMTLLMLVPLWFFWETQGFAWPGLVIWGLFVLPWAYRDIWRRGIVRRG